MRIAIVGGGAATISLLYQFIHKFTKMNQASKNLPDLIEICIIEKQDEIGPGLAYSTADNAHLLNLPAKTMSPLPEEPTHFFNWAVKNKALWQKDFPQVDIEICEYPPRALYGIYLKYLLNFLIQKAAKERIKITLMPRHEAVDVVKIANTQFKVIFSDEKKPSLLCDKVILSMGHLSSDNYCHFKKNVFYIHSPWPIETLKKIPPTASIFIAGTRLTAIDIVLSLKSNGHQEKIILGSKLGLLPCVIGKIDTSFNRTFLTHEKILELTGYGTTKLELNQALNLFKLEIEQGSEQKFGLESTTKPNVSAHAFLRDEIEEVQTGKIRHWQNVLFSLYDNISFMWDTLSEESKKIFIAQYYSVWMTYLAAFPLETAQKILAYLDKRELEAKGNLKEITYNERTRKFKITFNDETINCDYFINATGAGHDVSKTSSPLLQNMLKNKLLIPYDLGGVKVDFKTLQPIFNGSLVTTGLFVMGDSLTYGACLATADLRQSVKQATRITHTLTEQLKIQHSVKLQTA